MIGDFSLGNWSLPREVHTMCYIGNYSHHITKHDEDWFRWVVKNKERDIFTHAKQQCYSQKSIPIDGSEFRQTLCGLFKYLMIQTH